MAGNWGIVNHDEVRRFIFALDKFQHGNLSEDEFTAQRLQHGIYGQRQDDQYMVRIKVPGGILDREQLDCIGELTKKYCNTDFANITTRQDIQLHFVELGNVAKVLLRLADVGLTTREACGNTVRNVTACSLAGVCPQEHVDIRPLLNKTTLHFLRHPLTQHLPRKFKMSFSGCESDCAMGLIHDLAVIAVKKENIIGFKILVAGGLGHKPREAIVLEEFVEEKQIIPIIESIVTLHNRYSDRKKRAKSRLKFLVERFGEALFKQKYYQILQATENRLKSAESSQQGQVQHPMRWCNIDFKAREDVTEVKTTVDLKIPLGDIKPAQIKKISQTMVKFNLKEIRTTQEQNLLLTNVSEKNRTDIQQLLKFDREKTNNVIACPGAWTCRLGITNSRDMANVIASKIHSLNVNVSGCHNSCAQPQVTDIGLHGEGRRKFGKLLPYYRMYLGGDGTMNGGFALKGPEVPAVRVLSAIRKIEQHYHLNKIDAETFRTWARGKNKAFFSELLMEFTEISENNIPELLRDEGDSTDFRVLQLGGGECAGIAEETVSAYMSEVRYEQGFSEIFMRQSELSSALACAENILTLLAKSILFNAKESFDDDRLQVSSKLTKLFKASSSQLTYLSLYEKIDKLKSTTNKASVEDFLKELAEWHDIALIVIHTPEKLIQSADDTLDLREDALPLQYFKARKSFGNLAKGKSLKIIFRQGPDANLVSKGLESQGFKILVLDEKPELEQIILHMLKPLDFSTKEKPSGIEGQVA